MRGERKGKGTGGEGKGKREEKKEGKESLGPHLYHNVYAYEY